VSSPEEAELIALDYLEKNNYQGVDLKGVTDKIFKWQINFSTDSANGLIEVSKNGVVIGFYIKK